MGLRVSMPQNGGYTYHPTHCDSDVDHLGSIWAARKNEGLPYCDRGHGTLSEEGTTVQGAGSRCQGSGGVRVTTILPITWVTQDPPLCLAFPPGQTQRRGGCSLRGEVRA